MTAAQLLAALLAAAVILASLRMLAGLRRTDPGARPRSWRIAALLSLQAASGALLYLTLQPPTRPAEAGTMVVLTAGADMVDAQRAGEFVVALPEAPAVEDAARVPDLATALRRHPGTRRLRVLGAGLEARDRDAVGGRALAFEPAPLPRGIVELWSPRQVQAGAAFSVRGRVEGVPGGEAELFDPGGRRSDRVALADDGSFVLVGTARVPGLASFELRVRDHRRQALENAAIPLRVVASQPQRVLMLAGAPSPELKYLRRWASDAGLPLHTRIGLGGGMQIGDAAVPFDATSLGRFDLLLLDERAWTELGEARHAALRAAVGDGLGVLLRLSGPLPERERRRLQALGFALESARLPQAVRLPATPSAGAQARQETRVEQDADADADAGTDTDTDTDTASRTPALSRRALRIDAGDGVPLLQAADGVPLAVWRAEGRGRIAVWALADSFRLVLSGHGDHHARLWSEAFETLARARAEPAAELRGEARAGERVVLCGLPADARVTLPEGGQIELLLDPPQPAAAPGVEAGHPPRCAGFWPASPGWHALHQDGERAPWPFHVRARDALPGVHAHSLREHTAGLVREASGPLPPDVRVPGRRWPWLLGWLAVSALLWWLERSRRGRGG